MLEYHIWNKWKSTSVNKSLTFIDTELTVNTETSKLSVSSKNYYTVTHTCSLVMHTPHHAHPPMHTPAMHAPLPCIPLPCMPPCHARPLPCMPPATHAPSLWTEFLTHASENITLPQLRCGR